MKNDINMFQRICKLMIFVLLIIVFTFSVNAILLTTTPASGTVTVTSDSYNVVAEVQNDVLFDNLTNVYVNISISPANEGLTVVGSETIFLGFLEDFMLWGDDWSDLTTFNLSFSLEQSENFTITVSANGTTQSGNNYNTTSSTFYLNYNVITSPNIIAQVDNVTTTALDEFVFSVNVSNIGTGVKIFPFNVSLEYNNTLFDFVSCDLGSCTEINLGNGKNKTYYTINKLNASDSQLINFTFNANEDKGYSYDEIFKVTSVSSNVYPIVTVNPVPIYEANITRIYNNSLSVIDVLTNNLNVEIPVRVRNIGNEEISSLNIIAKINGLNLGSTSISNLAVGASTSPSYSYKLPAPGIYNVTINVTGSNGISDFDYKVLNYSFSFVDNDGDGFYPIANGGLDCNDNNATIYPGATEICGDGIIQDCNRGTDLACSTGGGGGSSRRDKDDDTEIIIPTPQEKEVELEENKPIIETLVINVPMKFKVSKLDEDHTVTIKQITDGFVALEIRSEPIIVILAQGESVHIDVDRDGFKDITITLNRILSTVRASITIQEYVKPSEDLDDEVDVGDLINDTDVIQNVTIGLNLTDDNLSIDDIKEPIFGDFISKRSVTEILILVILILFIILVGVGVVYRLNKGNDNGKGKQKKKEVNKNTNTKLNNENKVSRKNDNLSKVDEKVEKNVESALKKKAIEEASKPKK